MVMRREETQAWGWESWWSMVHGEKHGDRPHVVGGCAVVDIAQVDGRSMVLMVCREEM